MKHLLKISDISKEDITKLLNLADQLKYEKKQGIPHPRLSGKTLAMIFQKASTRTRASFEAGMVQLGGHPMIMNASDLQMGRGEPIEDTARVLSRYCDAIMIRTYSQAEVETLAEYASVPVINGLTDLAHPCQVLADLMTIREYKKVLEGLKLAFIGDANNMANSLIAGCLKMGMKVALACPKKYNLDMTVMQIAKEYGDAFTLTDDPYVAAKDADVIETDVWASMGNEAQAVQRRKDFEDYQVNHKLLSVAKEDAIVLHCLPAHRGEEITHETFETHAAEIFEQAENRLHAQKAVLVELLESK